MTDTSLDLVGNGASSVAVEIDTQTDTGWTYVLTLRGTGTEVKVRIDSEQMRRLIEESVMCAFPSSYDEIVATLP